VGEEACGPLFNPIKEALMDFKGIKVPRVRPLLNETPSDSPGSPSEFQLEQEAAYEKFFKDGKFPWDGGLAPEQWPLHPNPHSSAFPIYVQRWAEDFRVSHLKEKVVVGYLKPGFRLKEEFHKARTRPSSFEEKLSKQVKLLKQYEHRIFLFPKDEIESIKKQRGTLHPETSDSPDWTGEFFPTFVRPLAVKYLPVFYRPGKPGEKVGEKTGESVKSDFVCEAILSSTYFWRFEFCEAWEGPVQLELF
jgi:hypothetical protein